MRGWDSNPRSRAHEAREDSRSSTAHRRSGRQESNLRSPVPETGGVAVSPTSQTEDTPGGTRTRSFRVESPASSPLRPRGQARLRRQDSNLRLAINSRASYRSTTPERTEGEGVEPPGPEAHPFSRRDTAPVAVLPQVAPAGVEPAPSRVRTGSSAVLSYGAKRCGRQGSNLRRPAFQAGALPAELRPRVSGRGWSRTSDLLFVRQALVPAELLARRSGTRIRTSISTFRAWCPAG